MTKKLQRQKWNQVIYHLIPSVSLRCQKYVSYRNRRIRCLIFKKELAKKVSQLDRLSNHHQYLKGMKLVASKVDMYMLAIVIFIPESSKICVHHGAKQAYEGEKHCPILIG